MTRSIILIDYGEGSTGYVVFKAVALQEFTLEA